MNSVEREHVIGFSGRFRNTVKYHPRSKDELLFGMGTDVVIQRSNDAHEQGFLSGHDEEISAIALSATGTLTASGQVGSSSQATLDSTVLVWDTARRVEVYELPCIRKGVTALEFSPDELFLAATGEDCSFIVWDMKSGEILASKREDEVVTTLSWKIEKDPDCSRPQYFIYATVGPQVTCYRLRYSVANMHYNLTTELFRMPPGLLRDYLGSSISPDGRQLLLTTSVGDVSVYRLDSLLYDSHMSVCSSGAYSICAAAGSQNEGLGGVYIGGGDGTLKQLVPSRTNAKGSLYQWELQSEISLKGGVTSLSVSGCGTQLVAGTSAGCIYELMISPTDGQLSIIRVVQSETSGVIGCAFKEDCSVRFATLSRYGRVRVWDLSDYSIVAQAQERINSTGKNSDVSYGSCLFYDHIQDQVLTGWTGGQIRAYSATRGQTAGKKEWEIGIAHRGGVGCIVATDLYYASGGMGVGGGVRLWSRSSRQQLFQFPDHMQRTVTAVLPDVKSRHLLHSCSLDGSIYTYDLKRERRVGHHQLSHGGGFVSLSQRLDSENELISAGMDGRLLTWDCDVDDPVSEISLAHSRTSSHHSLTHVRVSPLTGQYVAACTSTGLLIVWNILTGFELSRIRAHGSEVNMVSWSPDEKQVVTVGNDKCINIWNFFGDIMMQPEEKN